MEASHKPHSDVPHFMRDDNLTEEGKNLISSSLPLDKDFLGKNLCNYKGFWYHYNTFQAILHVQKHFRPQDTDVILTSFPKTGTTWLKALTFAIVERGKYRGNPENHPLLSHNPHSLVPFLELDLYFQHQTPDLVNLASHVRLFSTHMPFLTLHEIVKESPCKIVYMCRNLKDAIVSDWYFRNKYMKDEMRGASFESFFDSFCRGVHFYGPFWDHALGYWRGSLENPKRVFFMKYEDMKREPHAQMKRLAEFLGYPFTEEEQQSGLVNEILKLCSFRNMSDLEINKTGKTIFDVETKNFFRKGEIGDWRNHLTSDMAKKIDEIIEQKLHDSGLKLE